MAFSQRLELRQAQSLVMTPQLQQAIKLLQMSNVELAEFVEQEIEQNPLLERDERDPDTGEAGAGEAERAATAAEAPEQPAVNGHDETGREAAGEPPIAGEDSESWNAAAGSEGQGDHDFAGDPEAWRERGGGAGFADELPSIEQTLARRVSLREHLLEQLAVDLADPADRLIGRHLVEMLDETGYLVGDLDGLAALLGCPPARIAATLTKLQRFDPPGVFARSLAECLALQLKERDRLDPAMQLLLDNLPLLASRDAAALRRVCGVDAEDLAEMVTEVKALDPKPGLAFDPAPAQPVTPDILMRAQPDGSGWIVELNGETLPRVLVNARYCATVSRASRDRREREYIAERLASANWLVKSLHQRATTILKVSSEIVEQQQGFFLHGVQYLRPLILRDIAEAIGMHESTVSRVTSNKYMATPRGIFELKYFFTASIAGSGGDAHSAEAVRFRIKGLVEDETADDVLSDERIVAILQKDGIDIARRTVAKYREALRIPSSVQRRREKALRF